MPEQKPQKSGPAPWQIPVAAEEVAEAGAHFDLVADAGVREAVAAVAGLRDLPRLEAHFDVARREPGGLHVTGVVVATVGQECVVTLEPLSSEIEETVDVRFMPAGAPTRPARGAEVKPHDPSWDDPEPLIGGAIDLGALATEFLILGINPYPRKPGAVFDPPQDGKPEAGPFAALAKLTKDQDVR
jgi:hypothetical protein